MKESSLNQSCVRWLNRQPGCWGWKVGAGPYQRAGLPDIVGHVRGRFFGAEGKVGVNDLSPIQKAVHAEIKRSGAPVFTYRSLQEFQEKVRGLGPTGVKPDPH